MGGHDIHSTRSTAVVWNKDQTNQEKLLEDVKVRKATTMASPYTRSMTTQDSTSPLFSGKSVTTLRYHL